MRFGRAPRWCFEWSLLGLLAAALAGCAGSMPPAAAAHGPDATGGSTAASEAHVAGASSAAKSPVGRGGSSQADNPERAGSGGREPSDSPPARRTGAAPAATKRQPAAPVSAPASASRAFRAASAAVDVPAQRSLALADAAHQRDDFATAVKHYREARRLAPHDPAAVVGLVMARLGAWKISTEYAGAPDDPRVDRLLELLEQAELLDPSFGPTHLQRGRLLLIKGLAQPAEAALQTAVDRLPRDAEAHSALGVAKLALGDKAAALEGFRRAAELEPGTAERQANLGTALMMHGDVRQAATAYRRAVQLAPNDARAHGDLGTALLAANDVETAMPHLTKAHQLAPQRATFMSNLGYAHQLRGDLDQAIHWYQRALERDARLNSAWINLATAYAHQQRFEEARRALDRAERIDPNDPRISANRQELEKMAAEARPQP